MDAEYKKLKEKLNNAKAELLLVPLKYANNIKLRESQKKAWERRVGIWERRLDEYRRTHNGYIRGND